MMIITMMGLQAQVHYLENHSFVLEENMEDPVPIFQIRVIVHQNGIEETIDIKHKERFLVKCESHDCIIFVNVKLNKEKNIHVFV